ncbi:MAG: HEAT repeat domain-containing protein [Candidatus Heimdallarchaeota archaeon]|nr:HEAT repeat domain-containing protein [Candidatus Heimdallarchaeota archaeon]
MENQLEQKLKRFNNLPDIKKLEELVSISEKEIDQNILDFLIGVIEKEKYEKIRIKAIFILKDTKKKEVIQKLMEFYAYERENSVKLVLVESIGDMISTKIDEFLRNVSTLDENDVVRSMAIRKLHERRKTEPDKMRSFLLDVIQNDKATFPIQISLSLIPNYADLKSLETLKLVYGRELKAKMRQLIYHTMSKIAESLNEELGIKEPVLEIDREDLDKSQKKKKKQRKAKKKKKGEEHLFF